MGERDGNPGAANAQVRIFTIRAPHIRQGNPALRLMQQNPGFNNIQVARLGRITEAFDKGATDREDQFAVGIRTDLGPSGT